MIITAPVAAALIWNACSGLEIQLNIWIGKTVKPASSHAKLKNGAKNYYLEIYPIRNNIQLKRSRRIEIRHSKHQKNILENYDDLPVIIQARYLKNSNKDNFLKFERIINTTSSITISKKENVIQLINTSTCD